MSRIHKHVYIFYLHFYFIFVFKNRNSRGISVALSFLCPFDDVLKEKKLSQGSLARINFRAPVKVPVKQDAPLY